MLHRMPRLPVLLIQLEARVHSNGELMEETIQGVIHGRTIEWTTEPGITDGVTVEVTIRRLPVRDPDAGASMIRVNGKRSVVGSASGGSDAIS